MMNVLTQAAQNKDTGFLDRMLDQKLSDGITVRSFIKPDKAIALYKQIDSAETAEYYRNLRLKNEQTDSLEQAVVDTLVAGGDPKSLENDQRFSALNANDRIVKIDQVSRNWRKYNGVDQPFEDDRKDFIKRQFDGIDDPEEAQALKFNLIAQAGSTLEKQFIREVFTQGKFSNPSSDPSFNLGRTEVLAYHKSTATFFGSDTAGPASIAYRKEWEATWYLPPEQLYEQHRDVIPETFKDRPLARMPLKVKNEVASKIAKKYEKFGTTTSGSSGVAGSARPGNPGSDKTLNKGETVTQGGLTIKKTD
jgi:hypothetical protein